MHDFRYHPGVLKDFTTDAYMDVGGRATHGAVAETQRTQKTTKHWLVCCFDKFLVEVSL